MQSHAGAYEGSPFGSINPALLDDPNEDARYEAEHVLTARCAGCGCACRPEDLTPGPEGDPECAECAPLGVPAVPTPAFHLARVSALRLAA